MQLDLYTAKLAPFGAKAVAAACDEWATTQSEWPSLAKLVALCREQAGPLRLADQSDSSGPESFFARCDRLGVTDLPKLGMAGYGEVLRQHDLGRLTDDDVLAGLDRVRAGRPPFDPPSGSPREIPVPIRLMAAE